MKATSEQVYEVEGPQTKADAAYVLQLCFALVRAASHTTANAGSPGSLQKKAQPYVINRRTQLTKRLPVK